MRYILKENMQVDFGIIKDYQIAERIGIHKVTLCNILNRKMDYRIVSLKRRGGLFSSPLFCYRRNYG